MTEMLGNKTSWNSGLFSVKEQRWRWSLADEKDENLLLRALCPIILTREAWIFEENGRGGRRGLRQRRVTSRPITRYQVENSGKKTGPKRRRRRINANKCSSLEIWLNGHNECQDLWDRRRTNDSRNCVMSFTFITALLSILELVHYEFCKFRIIFSFWNFY